MLIWTDSLVCPAIADMAPADCERIRTSTTTLEDPRASPNSLRFNYAKQRLWKVAAINRTDGAELGGLKIASAFFTPPIQTGNAVHGMPPEDTYAGNHWWLTQDIHVANATGRRDSTVLLARGLPGSNYDMHRATDQPPQLRGPLTSRPVIFCPKPFVVATIGVQASPAAAPAAAAAAHGALHMWSLSRMVGGQPLLPTSAVLNHMISVSEIKYSPEGRYTTAFALASVSPRAWLMAACSAAVSSVTPSPTAPKSRVLRKVVPRRKRKCDDRFS